MLLHGSREPILIQADSRYRKEKGGYTRPFEGILPILERQLRDASGEAQRQKLEKYLELVPCEVCGGQRLKPEALAVKVGPYRIPRTHSRQRRSDPRADRTIDGCGCP